MSVVATLAILRAAFFLHIGFSRLPTRFTPIMPQPESKPGKRGFRLLGKLKKTACKGVDKVVFAYQAGSAETKPYYYEELKPSPFEWRKRNHVTMYQDAHCSDDLPPPNFSDVKGKPRYIPQDCFEAIYHAILHAKRFIYITGWSVDTKISLVRRKPIFHEEDVERNEANGMLTMGELLKLKSEQGVVVLVHVWDEALSMDGSAIKMEGMMGTFDEETRRFFKDTMVACRLSYRTGFSKDNVFLWTHHQKSVIVDAALPDLNSQQLPGTPEAIASAKTKPDQHATTLRSRARQSMFNVMEELKTYSQPNVNGRRFCQVAFMTCEHNFEKVWDDSCTTARTILPGLVRPYPVTIYKPVPPEGWHIIGHIAERAHSTYPNSQTKVLIVKEPPATAGSPPLLAYPVDYERIWDNAAVIKSNMVTFWGPIAPRGYVALGHIAQKGIEKPPLTDVVCVHETAVQEARAVREEDHRCLWWGNSAVGHATIWSLRPVSAGLVSGTFIAFQSYRRPHFTHTFYCLNNPPLGVSPAKKPMESLSRTASVSQVSLPPPLSAIGRRRIIAFVGGLDLTSGRWDTPSHSLFRTLQKEHKQDFLHGWGLQQQYGPREPWHDIHARLEGPVARDVMCNFEQRWRKQCPKDVHLLVTIGPEIISEDSEEALQEQLVGVSETWTCRIVRSIDQYGADIGGREQGIQLAYVDAIRGAERFMYMENQYFLGSARHWPKQSATACHNLIPYEIAMRVCKGIKERRYFMAYILLPMYPEGWPEDAALQEILKWQWYTMSMMYRYIAEALEEAGLDFNPNKFLKFFCLGQRETLAGACPDVMEVPSSAVREFALNKSRRVPIYCHSKMLICDDERVICGSANINERSQAGDRDSEIAFEGYQPKYFKSERPRGLVHDFRMSLWGEHTNISCAEFLEPNTFACVDKIDAIAAANWKQFMAEEPSDMKSHLMPYPIVVHGDGVLQPALPTFPDTNAPICGTSSAAMPDLLTT